MSQPKWSKPRLVKVNTSIQSMKQLKQLLGLFLVILLLANCQKAEPLLYDGLGKKPIYATPSELIDIKSMPPRSIVTTGTIFLSDTLFFVLDERRGIHIYNVKDSASTAPITFINIPSITDFTLVGNYLYVDSWRDLVVVDISNLLAAKEVGRTTNVFEPLLYPDNYSGNFECVDESKGAVVGWQDTILVDAACFTN
jgi:hypothetical protein